MTNTTRTPLTLTPEAAAWLDAHRAELGQGEIREATVQGRREPVTLPTDNWRTRTPKTFTGRTMAWYRMDGTFIGAPAPRNGVNEYKYRGAATIRELPIIELINRNFLKPIFAYGFVPTYKAYTGRVKTLNNTTSTVEMDVATFYKMKNAKNHRKSNGLRADELTLSIDSSPVAFDQMRQLADHNTAMGNLMAEADRSDDKAFLLKVLGLLSPKQLKAIQEKADGKAQSDSSGKTLLSARKLALQSI